MALDTVAALAAPSAAGAIRLGGPNLPSQPAAGNLPGSAVLSSFTNGLEGWALIAAVAGVVIGAVVWGFSRGTTPR